MAGKCQKRLINLGKCLALSLFVKLVHKSQENENQSIIADNNLFSTIDGFVPALLDFGVNLGRVEALQLVMESDEADSAQNEVQSDSQI
jgi:hypothetical protein